MSNCYHCGNEFENLHYCNNCGQYYCYLHKEPLDHECNIVKETLGMINNQFSSSNNPISDVSSPHRYPQQTSMPSNEIENSSEARSDGNFTWYRRESNIPENAFDSDSGIEFKGILLPYQSEFMHLLIGCVLIYIIGLINFYQPEQQAQLSAKGIGWIVFMLAGFYTTAFLFHELGHRQVAVHFGLQTKFRLLKFGMIITVFGLIMGISSLATNSQALPSIALPGAVVVLGLDKIDRKTGLCKSAGPLVNLVYGSILLILSFFISNYPINFFIGQAASLNFMLGLFNLIPIGILDGENIFKWNKKVYFSLVISMVFLITINYICIYLPPEINPYLLL
ncbi:MAG: hypothetical protein KGD63_05475 [Candidatus Lokiarchaeota archaeon]|nr:hypothetical protein [Candidatus Lokiarchaeota archaeon]